MFPTDDDSDKTVFRGGAGGDETVLRPTPGGRGAPRPPTPEPQAAPSPAPAQQQAPRGPEQFQFSVTHGLNPLVNSASTLLAVLVTLRHTVSHPDPNGLYQRLGHEIKSFEAKAKEKGMRPEIVLAARYCICSAVDEAVFSTPWGVESPWMQRTLLSAFHNETSGGEKFFQIVDRMRQTPADNIEMIEFLYLIISLGFEGRYRLIDRGRDMLEQIRDELFKITRMHRGEYERDLSGHWHSSAVKRTKLTEYIPLWVIASCVGVFLLLSYFGFRVWLYNSSADVYDDLVTIADYRENEAPARGFDREPGRSDRRDEVRESDSRTRADERPKYDLRGRGD